MGDYSYRDLQKDSSKYLAEAQYEIKFQNGRKIPADSVLKVQVWSSEVGAFGYDKNSIILVSTAKEESFHIKIVNFTKLIEDDALLLYKLVE